MSFCLFNVFYFLCIVTRPKYFHAYVGLTRPGGSSPLDRRAGARFVQWGDDLMGEIEENLERLTLDIHDALIDDLPMRYQRNTISIPCHFSWLLHKVVEAIICYQEHHYTILHDVLLKDNIASGFCIILYCLKARVLQMRSHDLFL